MNKIIVQENITVAPQSTQKIAAMLIPRIIYRTYTAMAGLTLYDFTFCSLQCFFHFLDNIMKKIQNLKLFQYFYKVPNRLNSNICKID